MAVQQGSQDVKIFSSVRPLQIQRSFEAPSEVTDIAGSITRDVTVERHSSVTITSQTSSSPGMSIVNSAADAAPTSPFTVSPGTVIIKAASSTTTPASPGTVLIRSSAATAVPAEAPSTTSGGGGQNVVIIRSPSVPAQSTFIIKSATTPPVASTVTQPNAQSKIVISPAPIAQSRITITGGANPVPTARQPAETEVVSNETPANQPLQQARRSSLTIKTAPSPSSPTPVTDNYPAKIHQQNAVVIGGPLSSQSTVSEQIPQGSPLTESQTSEPTHPLTAAPVTATENLSEKIHQKKPVGPSLEEVLEKFDISKVFYIALAVLIMVVICILTEGEVPLSWILAAISAVSLGSFIALRL